METGVALALAGGTAGLALAEPLEPAAKIRALLTERGECVVFHGEVVFPRLMAHLMANVARIAGSFSEGGIVEIENPLFLSLKIEQ